MKLCLALLAVLFLGSLVSLKGALPFCFPFQAWEVCASWWIMPSPARHAFCDRERYISLRFQEHSDQNPVGDLCPHKRNHGCPPSYVIRCMLRNATGKWWLVGLCCHLVVNHLYYSVRLWNLEWRNHRTVELEKDIMGQYLASLLYFWVWRKESPPSKRQY